jgi:integrase
MRYYKEYRSRLKKEVWCVDGWINGERVRDSGWDTRGEAEDAIAFLRSNAKKKKYGQPIDAPVVTLGSALEEYEKDLDLEFRPHQNRYSKLKAFVDHFGTLTDVTTLGTATIRKFMLDEKKRRKLAIGTYNLELNYIGSLLNSVRKNFEVLADWRAHVMPRVPEIEGRSRVWSEDEVIKIFAALREEQRPGEFASRACNRYDLADLLEICLLTGMRVGEVQKLTWDKTAAGIVHISKTKTRKPRDLPIKKRLAEILKRREKSRTSQWVFPNTSCTGPYRIDYYLVRTEAQRAGLEFGRTGNGFTIHDLRHTFATISLRKGVDLATLADLRGHSAKTMTLRYSHSTLASREQAIEAIEDYGDPKKVDAKSPPKKRKK